MEYRQDTVLEVDDLEELVESGDVRALDSFLRILHPADMAKLFELLDPRHWKAVIQRLHIAEVSDLMEELPDHLRDDLAEHLDNEQLTSAFEEMASDDAADVISDLPDKLARQVLSALPNDDRREVEALLKYDEDTAGGLMQLELVSVAESATAGEAVEAIRANAQEVGGFHFVYAVDQHKKLAGVLSLPKLILASPDRPIRDLIKRDVHVVTPDVDQEEVARMFKRYDLVALPVINEQNQLLGRILHDDVVDVIEEEADEDIMHMAGAGADEPELVYTNRPFKIASVRLPWLLATLGGLVVPAMLLWLFQLTFPEMPALLPFIPVIGAMGGNVGTQSSTIVVRGFATGRVDIHNLGQFLGRELLVSFIMGAACGVAAGVFAQIWHANPYLGWIVGLAMLAAIVASAVLGVLIPYLFRLIRIDPAIAAGPLVTTIDDIVAIGIYFLVAVTVLMS